MEEFSACEDGCWSIATVGFSHREGRLGRIWFGILSVLWVSEEEWLVSFSFEIDGERDDDEREDTDDEEEDDSR